MSQRSRLAKMVTLFRRIGFIDPQAHRIRVRRAITLDDLEAAYTLVNAVFLEKGYIEPAPGGIRLRPYEALPEMATFVAEIEGQLVGVMSIVPDSPDLGLPSDKAFKPELDALRGKGRKVCEVTNLAVHKDFRNTGVFLALAQPIVAHAVSFGWDDLFIAISPGHAGFFQEVLQFESCGEARDYGACEKADIVEGKRWDMHTLESRFLAADAELGDAPFLHKHFYSENACRQYVRPWSTIAGRTFKDWAGLRQLFLVRSKFLQRCSPAELESIRLRWGTALYAEVCASEDYVFA
jgi:hypothetical protein